MQNLMGFLLQLTTEMEYYILISENIILYNLRSHGQFLQAWSHILIEHSSASLCLSNIRWLQGRAAESVHLTW